MTKLQIFLGWLITVLLLSACATPTTTPITPTAIVEGPSALSVGIASNDFGKGTPRVPMVFFQDSKPLADVRAVTITAFDLSSGTPVPGWSGNAITYADYDVPYWVIYPQLSYTGVWGFVAELTLANNTRAEAQFTIEVVSPTSAPDIGEMPPTSDNRTLRTVPDITKLTSDSSPEPGLYQLTVAEALKSGKPTVVTFATPAFCESRLCAPVVDSIKAVYMQFKELVNFIHIEVYKDFDPLTVADEMDEWQLSSEPWTFVLDTNGQVVARLGGPVSPRELEIILEPIAQP